MSIEDNCSSLLVPPSVLFMQLCVTSLATPPRATYIYTRMMKLMGNGRQTAAVAYVHNIMYMQIHMLHVATWTYAYPVSQNRV